MDKIEAQLKGQWLSSELDSQPYKIEVVVEYQRTLEQIYKQIQNNVKEIETICKNDKKIAEQLNECYQRENYYNACNNVFLESVGSDFDIELILKNRKDLSDLEKDKIREINNWRIIDGLVKDVHVANPDSYIDINFLIRYHSLLYTGTQSHGVLDIPRLRDGRDYGIVMEGLPFNPVDGQLVKSRVTRMLSELYFGEYKDKNVFERSAYFLTECIRIQPFEDGNKRISLIGVNYLLNKEGLPSISISADQRDLFMQNLKDAYLKRNLYGITRQIAKCVLNRQQKALNELRNLKIIQRVADIKKEDEAKAFYLPPPPNL